MALGGVDKRRPNLVSFGGDQTVERERGRGKEGRRGRGREEEEDGGAKKVWN